MKLAPLTLALATLALQAPSTRAMDLTDALANLDWSGLTITLIDLDPGDAFAPSLTWSDQQTGVSVLVSPPGGPATGSTVADWTSPVSVAVSPASAWADAGELGAKIQGITPATSFAEVFASRYGDFVLSPHTQVSFSLYAIVAAGDPSDVDILASAGISVWGLAGSNFAADGLSADNLGADASRELVVSFANLTDEARSGHLSANLILNAFAAPVPEPGIYAMLLAGLGLLGWKARHREV